ncbi:putative flavin monooxygenase, FAD/NAD(P)-binding domain superfamily [Septoria linicola]|nr:putative flavin monooxygenase, FAD/NAD(P)-binding domain superfamily [Septoria linicola]
MSCSNTSRKDIKQFRNLSGSHWLRKACYKQITKNAYALHLTTDRMLPISKPMPGPSLRAKASDSSLIRRKIAVIGAGPSGLAVANYLCAEGLHVTIIEQKPAVGGLWNAIEDNSRRDRWEKPVYEALETNIPRQLMTFSDMPWKRGTPLMPHNTLVKDYLQTYVNHLARKYASTNNLSAQMNATVLGVQKVSRNSNAMWKIDAGTLNIGRNYNQMEYFFDGVVVATGNYQRTFIPEYEGLREWDAQDMKKGEKSLAHSIDFDSTESYEGETVLIIGYGPSGFDISQHIARTANFTAVSTSRPDQPFARGVGAVFSGVEQFDVSTRTVTFKDGGKLFNVDKVVFCTGYKYEFPFLQRGGSSYQSLLPNGFQVKDLYEHLFCIEDPTLAFVGLPKGGLSFIIAEAQAAVLARTFAGRLGLPGKPQMKAKTQARNKNWQKQLLSGLVKASSYHDLPYPDDREYVNELRSWSSQAAPNTSGNQGQPPPYWCKCMDAARQQTGRLRAQYKSMSARRKQCYTTYESLGFELPLLCTDHSERTADSACCYLADA